MIDEAQKDTYIDIEEFATFILDLGLSSCTCKRLWTITNAIEEKQD